MPLVRIDHLEGRDEAQQLAIADAVHNAIVDVLRIPPRDRFQILTAHTEGRIVALDAGLGFERSQGVVVIQIFTQSGRSVETKRRLYATIAERLNGLGVAGEDVFISYIENSPADWSFGFGRAQYLEGDLQIPTPNVA